MGTRGRAHPFGLQHPERVHPALGLASSWWYADLCENADRQNHHLGCGTIRHNRECQGENPGQGGYSSGSATPDFRWQTTRGRAHPFGLQHPERVHPALGLASSWWYADLCENSDRQTITLDVEPSDTI